MATADDIALSAHDPFTYTTSGAWGVCARMDGYSSS